VDIALPLALDVGAGLPMSTTRMAPVIGIDIHTSNLTPVVRTGLTTWFAQRGAHADGTEGDVSSRWIVLPTPADAPRRVVASSHEAAATLLRILAHEDAPRP